MTVEDHRRKTLTLVACCFSLFIVTLDATIVNVALPSIQRDLGASLSGLQWILDAYTLVLASLLLTAGALGDRIGRRRVFQTGLVIFGLASLLCSLAPNLGLLVAFRAIQAVGGCMLTPTTMSIIVNTFTEPRERASAIGVWAGISGVSVAAGPVIGGLLVTSVGWRSIFWVNLPIVVIALVMSERYVAESRAPRPRRIDLPGQILAAGFLAVLTYTLIEGPSNGWGSATTVSLFAVAALALVGFLAVERRSAEPLLALAFFRNPSFSGAAAVAVVAFFAFIGFLLFNTLYLQEIRGYSALLAGVASLPATGAIIFASPISGKITGSRGPRLPVVVASILVGVGLLVLQLTTPTVSFGLLVIGYVLVGIGLGLINPPITNAAVSGMPVEQAGVASAVTGASRQVGLVMGVALIGSVVTSRFHSLLPGRLGALHLPPTLQASVIDRARAGGGVSLHTTASGLVGEISRVVANAFTAAIHTGYLLAAIAAFVAAVIALVTMGGRPAPSPEEEVAGAVSDAGARESAPGPVGAPAPALEG